MENKHNIANQPKNNPSFLEHMKKDTPFSVPNNYFESLHQVIINKKLENNNINNYFDKLSYRILAPSLIVLSLIAIVYFLPQNNSNNELTNEQISELIINEKLHEFDEDLIYDIYSESEMKEQEEIPLEDEIIEYLIDHNINTNLILEEL